MIDQRFDIGLIDAIHNGIDWNDVAASEEQRQGFFRQLSQDAVAPFASAILLEVDPVAKWFGDLSFHAGNLSFLDPYGNTRRHSTEAQCGQFTLKDLTKIRIHSTQIKPRHKKNHLVREYEVTVWSGRTYKIRTCDQRIKSADSFGEYW